MNLQDIGFDTWFSAHAPSCEEGYSFARVCAVDRGSFRITNESGEAPAELSGKMAYHIDRASDLPCVGDWVVTQYYDNGAAGIIHHVFPRRTFLRRKAAGENMEHQMIAANIDTAFIIQSCHFDFNPSRLERYLIMAADGQVEPVVLLTKTDLITQAELEDKRALIGAVTKARVIGMSSVSGAGFNELSESLVPGRTYCLLGSSGVGKTTLLNRLAGRDVFATRNVSGTGEGTHTTTRRQLIVLETGVMLIDTPGMRELGILGASLGVDMGFEELTALATACRYANCTHRHEPGCAVRAAIERGDLREERYAKYAKLKKEAEYNEMSSLDKRRKDKAFGRLVKSVKKRLKD